MKQIYGLNGLLGILVIVFAITITSCSNTPNSVTIGPNQNQCVQPEMYKSGTTLSPIIIGNPDTAPYCMSVTIQNNNSGLNANNIQTTSSGLTMSYTVESTTYSSQMYDPAAAGITINNANQTLGNVEVFDPNNCLTTSGANVVTINSGGMSCTFYMQILAESNPVGIYGTNLNYNYTNGNQNYSVSTNVNQRVNLYAGGTAGLFVDETGAWLPGSSLQGLNSITGTVTGLARDLYGNIYISTAQLVYLYNGMSTTQVANAIPGVQINGITTDLNASVYIATNQGIYKFNPDESSTVWTPYNDLSTPSQITATTNVVSIKGYENFESVNVIYATTESQAYVCNTQSDLNGSLGCHWTLLNNGVSPNIFSPNALAVDYYNNLYTANESSVNTYTTLWQNIGYFLQPGTTTGTLSSIYWTLFSNTQILYVGEHNTLSSTENTVYLCNPSPSGCGPVQSSNNNSLTGNVFAVVSDGANNLYAVGNGLNSADFATTPNVFGAFLTVPSSGFVASTPWTPISNGSPAVISGGSLTILKVSSMLTSY
ncbi:MAG: hypothetical protein K0R14_833 [Burkholderiales bacterium]|jgi:hypothetical protein|nr:hypothetical protein [Burkholderiales bacterium]